MHTSRHLFTLGAVLLLTLAGCSGVPSGGTSAGGVPTDAADADVPPAGPPAEVAVMWLDEGMIVLDLAVGGCVPSRGEVTGDAHAVTIALEPTPSGSCSPSRQRRGFVAALPESTDRSMPITVTVSGLGDDRTVTLPADAEGAIFPDVDFSDPAVAWVGGTTFAFLTRGSSSCAPVDAAVQTTGEGTASVRFDPWADDVRVCTADLTTQVTFVEAPGVSTDTVFTLEGWGADDGTVTVTP